jgi:hypothetical protein
MSMTSIIPMGGVNQVVRVDPDRTEDDPVGQVILSGPRTGGGAGDALVLAGEQDDVLRRYGDRPYELMLADSVVASSLAMLIDGILADGLRVPPVKEPEPGADPEADPEVVLAKEVADYNRRLVEGIAFEEAMTDFLTTGLAYGCTLAEQDWAYAEEGPDAGQLVLKELAPKARTAWAFVVDPYLRILGVLAATEEGQAFVGREKLMLLAWRPRGRDPRGTSAFRAAYNPWSSKIQGQPKHMDLLVGFAEPSVVVEMPPKDQMPDPIVPLNSDGTPNYFVRAMPPEKWIEGQIKKFRGGSYLILPPGCKAQIVEPKADGSAFLKSGDAWDDQIRAAILHAPRVSNNAPHGSRADSQTASTVVGSIQRYGQRLLAGIWRRDVFHPANVRRWGKEVADRLTPWPTFSGGDDTDQVGQWNAVANLNRSAAITDDMRPKLYASVGLPIPAAPPEEQEEEDDEAQNTLPPHDDPDEGEEE